eukprot:ctg_2464.g760
MIVGLSSSADGRLLFSCSGDSGVCAWEWPESFGDAPQQPSSVFRARGSAFSALDVALENSASTATFATGTEAGQLWLWHTDRSEPMLRLQDAAAATEELALITSVRFHPSDASLLSSSGADRRVRLFDVRQRGSVGNTRLPMRANEVAWNPMDTYLLSVATDDHNVYTHDMRRLDRVRSTQVGHVGAVLSVHYSPTGRELCTGSYDSLVRIYPTHARQARDVYYTRRMQRVFAVRFSSDAHYLLSGSDDGNVRVWKTHASEPLRPLLPRERRALDHANALKRKFSQRIPARPLLGLRHVGVLATARRPVGGRFTRVLVYLGDAGARSPPVPVGACASVARLPSSGGQGGGASAAAQTEKLHERPDGHARPGHVWLHATSPNAGGARGRRVYRRLESGGGAEHDQRGHAGRGRVRQGHTRAARGRLRDCAPHDVPRRAAGGRRAPQRHGHRVGGGQARGQGAHQPRTVRVRKAGPDAHRVHPEGLSGGRRQAEGDAAPADSVAEGAGQGVAYRSESRSLSERMLFTHGDTPEGMVESALECVRQGVGDDGGVSAAGAPARRRTHGLPAAPGRDRGRRRRVRPHQVQHRHRRVAGRGPRRHHSGVAHGTPAERDPGVLQHSAGARPAPHHGGVRGVPVVRAHAVQHRGGAARGARRHQAHARAEHRGDGLYRERAGRDGRRRLRLRGQVRRQDQFIPRAGRDTYRAGESRRGGVDRADERGWGVGGSTGAAGSGSRSAERRQRQRGANRSRWRRCREAPDGRGDVIHSG